jgi:Terminase large subunit, T4likevirus-type, N-terminal
MGKAYVFKEADGRRTRRRTAEAVAAKREEWLGFEPDARQAELLRRDVRRLVLNCTRQWGKSTVTAAKAVARAQEREGSLTLVVSPSARQSGEFLRKAAAFLRRMGIRPRGDGDNEISLLLPNGSRLVGLPGTEATVRGFSAVSLMLIDEAARVSDEMYKSVRPMLAVGDGDLWLMSTPFGKRGFFWEEWANGGEGWERVAVPATACPRILASFLEEERRSLGDRWFRQEYLCEFLEADDVLFKREVVERAVTDRVRPLF